MGSQAPMFRADVLRRMVNDWLAQGCAVEIEPDGRIKVTPPAATIQRGPDPDFVNWSRK